MGEEIVVDFQHIAILSPLLHHIGEFGGGITPWLVNLANGFVARGAKVDILVNAKAKTHLEYTPLGSSINVINQGYHKIEALIRLTKYLRNTHPNILMTAGYRYNTLGALANLFARVNIKVYLSVHENVSEGSNDMKSWKRNLRFHGIRTLYSSADGVIAVSKGVADDLSTLGLPRNCIKVIYNPIVNSNLIEKSQERINHPWFQPKTKPVLLGAGRLEPQKDFSTLIRAFAKVLKQRSCRLLILGEGKERSALQTLVDKLDLQDSIAMPGHVDNPFVFMAQSDVFVLSSAWEGFGNVIAEALAIGTPVISTDCRSGPREILKNGQFGPLVPIRDPDTLAKAIIETLSQPIDREALKQRGHAFSVEASINQYWQYMIGELRHHK